MIKRTLKILLPKFLKSFLIYKIWKLHGKNFCFFYNLISKLLYDKKNHVIYDGKKYILNEPNLKWSFSYEERGLWYLNGIKERGKKLHIDYGIEEIKFNQGDIIIDVGADVGDFKNGFDEEIDYYAFEPDPGLFKSLKFNCEEKNCFNLGIWKDDEKEISFYIDNKIKKKSIIKIPGKTVEIKIKTSTLDSIIKKIDKKIKLIKIDTTGSEPEVLYGLNKFLSDVEYVVVDASNERGFNKKHTINECLNYMYKNNFQVKNFEIIRSCILFQNKS
jgi:FkbM family methyltransferase